MGTVRGIRFPARGQEMHVQEPFVSYKLDSGYEKALLRPENSLFREVYPYI